MDTALRTLLDKLWQQYSEKNPNVSYIHTLLCEQGEVPHNDHIAFRTINDPRVDIDVIAKPFVEMGYHAVKTYTFPVKKLRAQHYIHPDPYAPKLFVSALQREAFSPSLQAIWKTNIDAIVPEQCVGDTLLFSEVSWPPLRYSVYQDLHSESEYAAWLYAFGYCVNHFTINVNALQHFNDLSELNLFVKEAGYTLNPAGGEIKGSPEEGLAQSSTVAEPVSVCFQEGARTIPCCYYEFAQRFPIGAEGKLYTGFVAASADKLFESTSNAKEGS